MAKRCGRVHFIKDADAGSARIQVASFSAGDVVAVHGYAGLNVQAAPGGALLALSDGSQVLFGGASVAAMQDALRIV